MTVFLFCFFLQASSLSRQKNNTIKCLWEKFLPQMLFILKYRVWTNRWQWQELQSHNHRVSIRWECLQSSFLPKTGDTQRSDQEVLYFFQLAFENLWERTDSPGNLFHLFSSPAVLLISSLLYSFMLLVSVCACCPHSPTTHHCEEPGSC